MFKIIKEAKQIIDRFESVGYKAYLVGGCVRDYLMDKEPKDWDIATDATPEETKTLFSHVIETGIQHGTVTVLWDRRSFEVTTFRNEGTYSDGRHPDSVRFSKDIYEDLKRRDFTINAIAYNGIEFVDSFDGKRDIEKGIIRCVGNPYERFEEDALRILRAIRFSATLGFKIEEKTYEAMLAQKTNLKRISVERIYSELSKMLLGDSVEAVLEDNFDVLSVVLPEILPMKGCEQNHPCHIYDVWRHTIKVVAAIGGEGNSDMDLLRLRLAALFHDIGKPSTKALGDDMKDHFHRHNSVSKEIAMEIFNRLNVDNATKDYVCLLIKYHDMVIDNNDAMLKKWMNRLTPKGLMDLIELKIADTKGQAECVQHRVKEHRLMQERVVQLIKEGTCFSLKDLAVKGGDLIQLGVEPGPRVGEILRYLLNEVVEGRIANDKKILLEEAKGRYK